MNEQQSHGQRFAIAITSFALLYPALLTWVYFLLLEDAAKPTQQAVYLIGKAIQFGLPIAWVGWICGQKLRWPKFSTRGLLSGLVFGLFFGGAAVAIYFGALKSAGWFETAAGKMGRRLREFGINSAAEYAAVALFYSLIHSLLEEYYWRWFVFGRLRQKISLTAAIAISSIAFMGHHVIVLGIYFGWDSPWTYLFSLATAIGGAFWAWLYNRSGSIYGPWLSHMLLDAAIFGVGYDLMRTVR
jgi:uncharacterized protein